MSDTTDDEQGTAVRQHKKNAMAEFKKFTEEASNYRHLEKMSVLELLTNINNENKTVPFAVEKAIPQIEKLVSAIADKMLALTSEVSI